MIIAPGKTRYGRFSTNSAQTGGLTDADALPTVTVEVDGQATVPTGLTVEDIGEGRYRYSYVVGADWPLGSQVTEVISVEVGDVLGETVREYTVDLTIGSRLATTGYTAPPSANTIAAQVWVAGGRTLSSFGTLVTDLATAAAAAILGTPANKLATDSQGRVSVAPQVFGDPDLDVAYNWVGSSFIDAGSRQYIKVEVTVTRNGVPLTASVFGPPQIALATSRTVEREYHLMEWEENSNVARLLIGPETNVELDPGPYYRFLRVEAGDEDEVQEIKGVLVVR